MDADVNLGFKPSDNASRDAIHIAVIPMIAGERLLVASRVSVFDGECFIYRGDREAVGIVDPYRRTAVNKGDRFWLCLFPKTVTSLRHHWEHPEFPADEPEPQKPQVSELEESERWLREYAKAMNPEDSPNNAYTRLIYGLESGELFAHGSDLHGLADVTDAEELKYHAEKVLGIKIDFGNFTFRCSC